MEERAVDDGQAGTGAGPYAGGRPAPEPFTLEDGGRLIAFGEGAVVGAPGLLAEWGFEGYALLTTERARAAAPAVVAGAATVLLVPPGGVPEAAASVRADVGSRPLVALGGGRVVDVAKAIAGAEGLACAAIPTTLSGAPFTPFHRLPAGERRGALVAPSRVIADPTLMASPLGPRLVATAMNALAHAMEALYGPGAHPQWEASALAAAALFADAVPHVVPSEGRGLQPSPVAPPRLGMAHPSDERLRLDLALGALRAGLAFGHAGFAVHHAVCQTIVRTCGTPHAETNAVMLPHSARLMAGRAPREIGLLAGALGDPAGDPAAAGDRIAALAAPAGVTGLAALGVTPAAVEAVALNAVGHPALGRTPGGVSHADVVRLISGAL